jgi:hypothetical protein
LSVSSFNLAQTFIFNRMIDRARIAHLTKEIAAATGGFQPSRRMRLGECVI